MPRPPGDEPSAEAPGGADPRAGAAALEEALRWLAERGPLGEARAERAFTAVMDGHGSDAAIAALLMGLRVRGETASDLAGAVRAIRARMRPVEAPAGAIDVCGTGGDGRDTLNLSTAVAFVARAAGVPVAKHGNAALSSRSGGADVLRALGIDPDPDPARQQALLDTHGIAFLFAPRHHAALRHAAAARRALGLRTLLNLAGPLCNPAGVRRQLLGVFDQAWLRPVAEALASLGTERAWVVHGGGLDELTPDGETAVASVEDGRVRSFRVSPADAGLAGAPVSAIAGGTAAENARALSAMLAGERGAHRDAVLLNAAAALLVAGVAEDLRHGAALAARAIDGGAAMALLETLRAALPVAAPARVHGPARSHRPAPASGAAPERAGAEPVRERAAARTAGGNEGDWE